MKKVFFALMASALMAASFTSCDGCRKCELDGYEGDVCKDDFESKAEWKETLQEIRDEGGKCQRL